MNRTNIKQTALIALLGLCFFSLLTFVSCQKEDEDKKPDTSQNTNKPSNNQPTVKEETKYTVSYSSDFGVAPQSLTVKKGDELTCSDLKPLDTDGYIFLGWYNGSKQVEEGFVVKQDLKLVAKWTKDGVVYANELKDFLAKKTDDSKVYDITISDLNPDVDIVVKALKDNPKIKVNLNLENCTELKDLKIMPDGGISKSKTESFLINLVSLTLPNGVVNIVLGCDGLTSINIPNSVTTIEIYTETPPSIRNANAINPDCKIYVEKECVDAFKNAEGWKTVAIQIKTIGGNYLYANELNDFMAKQTDESKVYDVAILDLKPDMDVIVKALIDNPKVKINLDLEGCTELTEVKIIFEHIVRYTDPNDNGGYDFKSAYNFKLPMIISLSFPNTITIVDLKNCDMLTTLKVPNGVTNLRLYCKALTSLTIPTSVTNLDLECESLTSLNVPNGVTNLRLHCQALTSLTIPTSVTNLDLECESLTSLNVPNGVTNLRLYCKALTSLKIPTSVTDLDLWCESLTSLDVPNSVINLRLSDCGLTSLDVPNSVINLWIDCCENLTKLEISNGVTSFFYREMDNGNLSTLSIPNSVTNLSFRLDLSESLKSIIINNPNPPKQFSTQYGGSCLEWQTIYVPACAVEQYKKEEWWNEYADQIQPIE